MTTRTVVVLAVAVCACLFTAGVRAQFMKAHRRQSGQARITIDRIVARAREIRESSAGERLPSPGQQDEIGRLVDTLNDMLARIDGD